MSQINMSDRVLARIVESVAEKARANPSASKSALLNVAAAEVAGPGRDWGLLKNAAAPVFSRDLAGTPAKSAGKKADAGQAAAIAPEKVRGYRYDLTFTFVSETEYDLSKMSLAGVEYECEDGDAVGGMLSITPKPLGLAERNALVRELGSDPSFFRADDDSSDVIIEVRARVPVADLDGEDLTSSGEDAISGTYLVTGASREADDDEAVLEAALDVFRERIRIAGPGNYDVVPRFRLWDEPADTIPEAGEASDPPSP